MRLDVPYHSQYNDDVPESWQRSSCGVVALKMALDFYLSTAPSVSKLIDQGVAMGAYLEGVGWKHDGLIQLAESHGVHAWREEYKEDRERGVKELIAQLDKKVISLVSVATDHTNPKTFHLVLLTGHDDNGFYYHDPALGIEKGKGVFISFESFTRYWRGLVVFVGK